MNITEQVRRILATKGLTLYGTSQLSVKIFGPNSSFRVPHTLYHDLSASSRSPSIHQVYALSRITNYSLCDWLAVFGFRLDEIVNLQFLFPRKRTVLLDSTVYEKREWIPWFVEATGSHSTRDISPLGEFLTRGSPTRASELLPTIASRFLYAKVGSEDAPTCSEFGRGTIIRVDTSHPSDWFFVQRTTADNRVFFTEHAHSFGCSRLAFLGKGKVALNSSRFPFSQIELTVGNQIRILGVIDAELRLLVSHGSEQSQATQASRLRPRVSLVLNSPSSVGELIRVSRIRAGLSFRDASEMTRSIAQMLGNKLYITAPSTLSDYETLSVPPRHIEKVIALCVVYSIGFWDFLRAAGLFPEQAGGEAIPDELVPRKIPPTKSEPYAGTSARPSSTLTRRFLDSLTEEWQEIPLFLRKSLSALTGVNNFSVSDVFWVGGNRSPIHPWLENATFVAVNRRLKTPVQFTASTLLEQPLYLLLGRDGKYFCACCTSEHGLVVVHPYPDRPFSPRRFKNGTDAEVIGQVTAILRRLDSGRVLQ